MTNDAAVALEYTPGKLDETAPIRVWLQIDTDGDNDERDEEFPGTEHVSWFDESIGGLEVQYVRIDLHATTVAELRAEADRLNRFLDEGGRRLVDENARADAAERRVAELERVCKPIIEKSIAISKTTSSVFTSDLRRLLAALTKESP